MGVTSIRYNDDTMNWHTIKFCKSQITFYQKLISLAFLQKHCFRFNFISDLREIFVFQEVFHILYAKSGGQTWKYAQANLNFAQNVLHIWWVNPFCKNVPIYLNYFHSPTAFAVESTEVKKKNHWKWSKMWEELVTHRIPTLKMLSTKN